MNGGNNVKCAQCPRSYKTTAALAQHKKDSHPLAQKSARGAVRANRGGRGARGGGRGALRGARSGPVYGARVIEGVDIIGSFEATPATTVGTVVAGGSLSPSFMEETRLYAESTLYTRWQPLMLVLEIVSSAGAMTSGSYIAGWVANPDTWLDNKSSSVSIVASFKPSVQTHISKSAILRIPTVTTQKWYVLDNASSMTDRCHGKFLIVIAGSIGNITGSSRFNFTVRLRYRIRFDGPTLPVVGALSENGVYADAGFESYFTDSVSDWSQGKYLTLKHKQGGAAVTFDNLKANCIYKLDMAAILTYNKGGGKPRVYYGVQIIGYATKAMAVFGDLASSRNYIKTKDEKYCLTYESAGDSIIPTNPKWMEYELKSVHKEAAVEDLRRQVSMLTTLVAGLTPQRSSIDVAVTDTVVREDIARTTELLEACTEISLGVGVVNVALVPAESQYEVVE